MILAGDIGGTKVNLALFGSSTRITQKRYESRDFSSIEKILDDFLKDNESTIEKACFGVAGQVTNEKCSFTNLSWQVEVECLKKHLGIDAVAAKSLISQTASIPKCFFKHSTSTCQERLVKLHFSLVT
jgi:glucokinase